MRSSSLEGICVRKPDDNNQRVGGSAHSFLSAKHWISAQRMFGPPRQSNCRDTWRAIRLYLPLPLGYIQSKARNCAVGATRGQSKWGRDSGHSDEQLGLHSGLCRLTRSLWSVQSDWTILVWSTRTTSVGATYLGRPLANGRGKTKFNSVCCSACSDQSYCKTPVSPIS